MNAWLPRDPPSRRAALRYMAARTALDMRGLGEAAAERLVSSGAVKQLADLFERASRGPAAVADRARHSGEATMPEPPEPRIARSRWNRSGVRAAWPLQMPSKWHT